MCKIFAVTRVSSHAINEALVRTLIARWVRSPEFPIGVETMQRPAILEFAKCLLLLVIWLSSDTLVLVLSFLGRERDF